MRLYPHKVSAEGDIIYHALCEILDKSRRKEIRSSFFNNALIRVNNSELHLDQGFVETHPGENYQDYIVDGRFLYTGEALNLDSHDQVRVQFVHPDIGSVERVFTVPASVREVQTSKDELRLWRGGEIAGLEIQWTEEDCDLFKIVAIVYSLDGKSERTTFYSEVPRTYIERNALALPSGHECAFQEIVIEIISCNNVEFDIERAHCCWMVESPFAYRLILD